MWLSQGGSCNILEAVRQAHWGCRWHHQWSAQGWLPATATTSSGTNHIRSCDRCRYLSPSGLLSTHWYWLRTVECWHHISWSTTSVQKAKTTQSCRHWWHQTRVPFGCGCCPQQPLLIAFNKILCEGYCESLSVGIIHALYKGGDCSQFDNYRGITVGPVLAKVFAMILESRISQWVETNDLRAKG